MKHLKIRIIERLKKVNLKERALNGNVILKIVIAYILLVLLPISGVMYFYYRQSVSIAMDQVVQTKYQSLTQTAVHLTSQLETVQEASNSLFADKILNELIMTPSDGQPVSAVVREYNQILGIINNYQRNDHIFRIRLFLNREKTYLSEGVNFFRYDELTALPWFPQVLEKNGASYWKSTYAHQFSKVTDDERVVTCARLLKNLNQYDEIIGGLLIDIQEQDLYDTVNSTMPDKEKLFILDAEGIIISHGDKSLIGTPYQSPDPSTGISGLTEGIHAYQDKFLMCTLVEPAGWRIISETSVNAVFAEGRNYKNFLDVLIMLGVFILLFTVFLASFWFLVLRMNSRIKHIVRKIKTEGIDSLDASPLTGSKDLRNLEVGIDYLTQNMKKLMKEAYQVRIEKKETELRLLQAQINPHFLYNTLDSINWMAIRAHAEEVGEMIQLLSSYFRLSLNYGKDIISIRDEIHLADVYLSLQNNRFSQIISVAFDVDSRVLQYAIPKLTLQPVIENAILHGLQNRDDHDWNLSISANMVGDNICLTVRDNGVGIQPEVLAGLLKKHEDRGQHGYGLYNVDRRIKLFFGPDCGIQIESQPDSGTIVIVHIKAIQLKQNEDIKGDYL